MRGPTLKWLAIAAITICLPLVSCSAETTEQPQMVLDGSRAVTYHSLADLTADASAVIIGTVVGTAVIPTAGHDIPITRADVRVEKILRIPKELNSREVDPSSIDPKIAILQFGTADYVSLPAPLLQIGSEYLLFVSAASPVEDPSGIFYITGANAGIFKQIDGDQFSRVDMLSGDDLPTTIGPQDVVD